MKRNIVWLLFLLAILASCREQKTNRNNQEVKTEDTVAVKSNSIDTLKTSKLNELEKFTFFGGDSITVVLQKDSSTQKKLRFSVEANNKKFEGVANLELIEDNGKLYLPESSPRLDEKTNQEYMCDSTFSYQSDTISFVFAMENRTKKRLSFVVNNSSVAGVGDNFYTLY
ncbi:MAG: hypothetical protein EOO89_17700, partial [Pedobacter sp.]